MFLKSLLGNEDHMEDDRLGKMLTSARGRRKKEDVADFWQQVSAFKEGDEVEMRNYRGDQRVDFPLHSEKSQQRYEQRIGPRRLLLSSPPPGDD